MFNRKLEIVFAFLLVFVYLGIFSIFFPQEINNLTVGSVFFILSLLLMCLTVCLYRKISNQTVIKKANKFIYNNEIENALNYIDGLLKKQPHILILKVKKLELLVLSGKISEYQSLILELPRSTISIDGLVMIGNFIRFLQQEELLFIDFNKTKTLDSSFTWKINYLLFNKDSIPKEQMLSLTTEISNSPMDMHRCIIFVFLYLYYKNEGDKTKQKLYREKAINVSPSLEVNSCLDFIFANDNKQDN